MRPHVTWLAACTLLQGCYLGDWSKTYPAPRPEGGSDIVFTKSPDPPGPQPDLLYNCRRAATGPSSPSRTSVFFRTGAIDLCFSTPRTGVSQPMHDGIGWPLCMGPLLHSDDQHRTLNFIVDAEGQDRAYEDTIATLESAGRVLQARAEVYAGAHQPDRMVFRFDLVCDPAVLYRVTIRGFRVHGAPVVVPTVDFEPFTEKLPAIVD